MYFTIKEKTNYYDCDQRNRLKISAAMRYMQQTSSEQLANDGYPVQLLEEEGIAFLLSKMCIKIHRMPLCNEYLVTGTAPIELRGVRFVREFIIDTAKGERLLSALSLWVLVDLKTRRILRPKSFPHPFAFQKGKLGDIIDDVAFPKAEKSAAPHLQIPVCYSHIDVNQHVNNTVYADFVCDALPLEKLLSCDFDIFCIEYQKEALWGDRLAVGTTALSQTEYLIHGGLGEQSSFRGYVRLK